MSSENQPDKPESKLGPIITVIGLMSAIFTILQAVLPSGLTPPIAAIAVGIISAVALIWSGKLGWQTAALTLTVTGLFLIFIHLIISQPATVVGYAVRADGTPIGGVSLVLTNSNGVDQRIVTDQEGRFEIRSVPDGRYTITSNGRLLYAGEVPSGWQRIFNPSVNAGSLPVDTSIIVVPSPAASPNVPSTDTPVASLTPTGIYTPSHTATRISSQTPRPSPTQPVIGGVLFDEDFEDRVVQGDFSPTSLNIIADEIGNYVLDYDNTTSNNYAGADFGSENWGDIVFEYRVRILEYSGDWPTASVMFHYHLNPCCSYYVFTLNALSSSVSLEYSLEGSGWRGLGGQEMALSTNNWYAIRIVSRGERIEVFVNETPATNINTIPIEHQGFAQLQVAPRAHVQFDDIRITAA